MFKIENAKVKMTSIKKVSDKMTVGTVYSTHKTDEGFVKTFIPCKLVGKALNKFEALGIEAKERFIILEGSLRNEPYVNKKTGEIVTKHVITIFDLEKISEKDEPVAHFEDMTPITSGDIHF